MKKEIKNTITAAMLFIGIQLGCAQAKIVNEPIKKIKVVRTTQLEKFEPELVSTKEERLQNKKIRYDRITLQRSIIDTLNISDRKKEKLKELIYNRPYSKKISKVVETHFEDVQP